MSWAALEDRIGYRFQNEKLLETALTHSSFANEQDGAEAVSNERFEFLGDAVLGFETALMIFEMAPELSEGQMTAVRASIVRSDGLAEAARSIGLGGYLRLGVGAERTVVHENNAVLEDAFEALIAAVFLDGGQESARRAVRSLFAASVDENIRTFSAEGLHADYKSKLQVKLQRKGFANIRYEVKGESGPAHNKWFRVIVTYNGKELGTGEGKTKKDAEKMAAKMALEGF